MFVLGSKDTAMWWVPTTTLLVGIVSLVVMNTDGSGALRRARSLQAPVPRSSYGGEYEDHEWWECHRKLLLDARREYGRLHPELYDFKAYTKLGFIDSEMVDAIDSRNPSRIRALCRDTNIPNVYQVRLLTPLFAERFREEVQHHENSGIPMRRPNGMNRYGAILDDLGFTDSFESLVEQYLRPLAFLMFPDYVGPQDLDDHYGFVVNYKPDQDVELAEHADASTVTTNICLLPSQGPSPLYFRGYQYSEESKAAETAPSYVDLSEPGMALLHLGGHRHAISPIKSERSNLIVWMHGQFGYVRIAPYTQFEAQENKRQIYQRHKWKDSS